MKVVSRASRNHFLDALRGIAALLVLATHLQSSIVGFYPSGWLAIRLHLPYWSMGPSVWMCFF